MTPDQLARVLSAGEQHVHDPHTRSAINAMIGECHRIEDEQAVRLIEVQADFITPQGSDYVVSRADRSVHVAFIDLEHAENFEEWMRAGDWDEFLRWQRASRDTAPQPVLDEVVDDTIVDAPPIRVDEFLRENARRTVPIGTTMNLHGFTAAEPITGGQVLALDYMGRVAPCRPEDVDSIVGTAAMDANAGEQVEVAMPQHLWEVYRTGKLDKAADTWYKGMMVPTDLKQPAMDAGHPPDAPTAPYARGLPDEPMEPAQISEVYEPHPAIAVLSTPHQFEEHPVDSYFCKLCGNSHFHALHDVLEIK